MPVPKPKKGEPKDEFISRCMHEVSQSTTDRPVEQRVAICMNAWRAEHGGSPPKSDREQLVDILEGIAAILQKYYDPTPKH